MRKKLLATLTLALVLFQTGVPAIAYGEESIVGVDLSDESIAIEGNVGFVNTNDEKLGAKQISNGSDYQISVGEAGIDYLQLVITIENSNAPADYQFKIPGVVGLDRIAGDTGVIYRLFGVEGETHGWLSEPWARDAEGIAVPTTFEFSNGSLIQHIDFAGSNIAFPVTADPFLGINLISSVQVYSAGLFKNVKIAVTPWLGFQYAGAVLAGPWGYSAAVEVVQTYGWSEVVTKILANYGSVTQAYVTSRATFKNQWDCHALGAPVIFGATAIGQDPSPTWDLEGFRYSSAYLPTWINSNCNW